jgi:hypothetical protein
MADDTNDLNDEHGIRLRYVGGRFDGARLPLDVLADLPAFRDLLFAFAKQEWLAVNAARQRVPKGFDKSLAFDLTSIQDGSAVPVLKWDRSAAQTFLPGFAGELEEIVEVSYKDVVRLIDESSRDIYPKALASEHVRALNKFGSDLRANERIEFLGKNDAQGKVIYLDFSRRKNLLTKVRETYVSRLEDTGFLVGIHAAEGVQASLDVETLAHGIIKILMDRDRVIDEFDGNLLSPIQFDLQVELDNADKLRSIVEVHGVALIDVRIAADLERCRARLAEIEGFKDGWDDGRGSAADTKALEAARVFLGKRPLLCSVYKIFPTSEGGVLFEFEINDWDLSLEFAREGSVEIFGIQVEGDQELLPVRFDGIGAGLITEFDKYVGRDGR